MGIGKNKGYNEICQEAVERRHIARANYIRSGNQDAKEFLIERKHWKTITKRKKEVHKWDFGGR